MAQTENNSETEQSTHPFNPNLHLMQIKNRNGSSDYLPVQWRLVWFREQCPDGIIETEMLHLDLDRETEEEGYAWNNDTRRSEKIIKRANGLWVFKAVVKDGKGGIATGTKSEKAASFPDFIEKAETGSIGRALAALGYGTQFAPELDEGSRLADAPVDRSNTNPASQSGNRPTTSNQNPKAATPTTDANTTTLATDQQLKSLRILRQHLGKPEPEDEDKMTYLDAKATITALSQEYNEQKQQRKAELAVVEHKPEPTHDKQIPAAIARMIETARSRCEKASIDWEQIKAKALKQSVVPDYELVAGNFTFINGLITKVERGEEVA